MAAYSYEYHFELTGVTDVDFSRYFREIYSHTHTHIKRCLKML